jgi:uncharacterized cupin superfamily protein
LSEVAAIPIGSDVAMSPSSYVTAETLKEGDPAEREAVHLSSADDKFTVGSWSAEPGDSFTLTKGWRGEYRVTEPLVKQFAIYVH